MCEEAGGCRRVNTVRPVRGISVEYVRVNRAKTNTPRFVTVALPCHIDRVRLPSLVIRKSP